MADEVTRAKGLQGKLKHFNSNIMCNRNLFIDDPVLYKEFKKLKKSGDNKVSQITSRTFRDRYTSGKAIEENRKRIAQSASQDYQTALNIRFNMIIKKFPKPPGLKPKVPPLFNNNLRKLSSNLNTMMANSGSQNLSKYQVPDNFNEEAIMAELNEINNQIINKKPIKRDMFLFIQELYEQTYNHKYWNALDPYYQYPYLFRDIFETINKNNGSPKTTKITPEKLRENTIKLIRRLIGSRQSRDTEFLKTYITWRSTNGGTPNSVKSELQTVLNELRAAQSERVAEARQAELVPASGGKKNNKYKSTKTKNINVKKINVKKVGVYKTKGGYFYLRYKNGKVKRISKETYKKSKKK